MKKTLTLIGLLILAAAAYNAVANGEDYKMKHMMQDHKLSGMEDGRISLGLSPKMKQRQLSNMRSHLMAIQSIIGMIGDGKFDDASEIAHSKLGLTPEMRKMCNMFKNKKFRTLGLAFHGSGDALGDALKTKDINRSLLAVRTTLGYCVKCHATFRQ